MILLQSINWNPSPIIFELGPVAIRYYSLMFVIAFLLGIWVMKKVFKNDGVSVELVDTLFIFAVISILLGARLGDVFFYTGIESYKGRLWQILIPIQFKPEFQIIGFRGLASHGATIGMIVAMFLFRKKHLPKKSMLWLLDRVVLSIPIGGALVRIGNLMNSEIIGKYTGTNYGFVFERLGDTAPRHPTQIYEALSYLALFFVLWFVYWKTDKRHKQGYLFGLFMLLLWVIRFFIEFYKEAQEADRADWMLNTGQWLSIPMILVGVYFMYKSNTTQK